MKTQLEWKPQVEAGASLLEFDLAVEKKSPAGGLGVRLRVPYAKIWMTSGDNKELRTTLTVTLIGEDASGAKTQESSSAYPLSLTEEKVEGLRGEFYVIDLEFAPAPESRVLVVTLANSADKGTVSKRKKLKSSVRPAGRNFLYHADRQDPKGQSVSFKNAHQMALHGFGPHVGSWLRSGERIGNSRPGRSADSRLKSRRGTLP